MTRDVTPDLKSVRLFFTQPHDCSYLPDREATTAFVDPTLYVDKGLYSQLTHLGFRRSGRYFYAPRCRGCQACVSARIPVALFQPNRTQRRCLRRNTDISVTPIHAIDVEEHYPLYERYIHARHSDGDMYPPSRSQFLDFLGEGMEQTRYVEFRNGKQLLGCSVVDLLDDGISAIYTYFEPGLGRRSLGIFAILSLIDLADRLGLAYVYLGFWVSGCDKMEYKTAFRPLELLVDDVWRLQEKGNTASAR